MFPKQFRIHAVLLLACLFIIFFPLLSEKPDKEKAERATAEAGAFLTMVDAGRFAESWLEASTLLKERVKQEEWIDTLARSQAATGALVERSLESSSYSTTAEGSPEGEYILLVYDARFQRAASVSEYVTMAREGERWRVAGYFIK